jgi:hypothetical protein
VENNQPQDDFYIGINKQVFQGSHFNYAQRYKGNIMHELIENQNKETEAFKMEILELKDTVSEIKIH